MNPQTPIPTTITLQYRMMNDPVQAKRDGWTKNHRCLEFWISGKWRPMTYVTHKQHESGKWQKDIKRRIRLNSGMPTDYPIELQRLGPVL